MPWAVWDGAAKAGARGAGARDGFGIGLCQECLDSEEAGSICTGRTGSGEERASGWAGLERGKR